MKREPSICKRVPLEQAKIIQFIADLEDREFARTIKRVINSSSVFAEFRKQYELSANDG